MISEVKARFKLFTLTMGISGLAMGWFGCQSGAKEKIVRSPSEEATSPEGNMPVTPTRSVPTNPPKTTEKHTNVLDALRALSPEFGTTGSDGTGKSPKTGSNEVEHYPKYELPKTLKHLVGVELTCVKVIDAGQSVSLSDLPSAKPFKLTVNDQGKAVRIEIPGPRPGIVILSNGNIWGGGPVTIMGMFFSPADRKRYGAMIDFRFVPEPKESETNPLLLLEARIAEVWQRTTKFEVLDRGIRFTTEDGKDILEFLH